MPFAPYSDIDFDQIAPYYQKPGYVEGAPPLFGISFVSVVIGDTIAMYIPTQTTYYFQVVGDIPEPHEDWYVWRATYGDEWGYIEEEAPSWWTSWTQEYMWKLGAIEAAFALVFASVYSGVAAAIASALVGVQDQITAIWDLTAGFRETVADRIASARKYYGEVAAFIHLEQLRTIDHVLSLTWNDYYDKKIEIMRKMGAISKELFGDAHVLNQWFALGGMIWKDFAAATGRTWSEQDMEWFVKTNDFMMEIEDDLDYFARHPEQLWIRIEEGLMRPIYESRGEAYTGWEDERSQLRGWIRMVEGLNRTLDRKVLEYQLALPDNIKNEMGPELIQFRKDLRELWEGNLAPVISFIEERLLLNERDIMSNRTAMRAQSLTVAFHKVLLSDPKDITGDQLATQEDRMTAIQANLTARLSSFSEPLLKSLMPDFGKALEERERP